MNLDTILSVYGGGLGSGCKGPNCGRPKLDAPHDTSKIISVDFDGTIASHKPGEYSLGRPLKNGLKFLRELNKRGYTIHIHTARPNIPEVQDWLDKHGVGFAKATNTKFPSVAYVDDRALNWTGDQPVEEGLRRVAKMSEIRQQQVALGLERLKKSGAL